MGRAFAALLSAVLVLSCGAAQPSAVPLGGTSSTRAAAPAGRTAQAPEASTEPGAPSDEAAAPTADDGPAAVAPAGAQASKFRVGTKATRVTFMEFDLHVQGEVDGAPFAADMKGENREELVYKITRVEDGAIAELELSYVLASERMTGMGMDEREDGPLHGKTFRVDSRREALAIYDTRRRLAPAAEASTVEGDAREFLEMEKDFAELNAMGGTATKAQLEAAQRLVKTNDDVAVKNLKIEFRRLDKTRSGEPTAVYEGGCDIATTEGGVAVKGHLTGSVVLFTSPWRQHSVNLAGPVQFDGTMDDGTPLTGRGHAKIEVLFR